MNVAQLKRRHDDLVFVDVGGSHVRMNVAQLKQPVRSWQPRHDKRRSHVRMNVAQLKQVEGRQLRQSLAPFPRSNERGSIEA